MSNWLRTENAEGSTFRIFNPQNQVFMRSQNSVETDTKPTQAWTPTLHYQHTRRHDDGVFHIVDGRQHKAGVDLLLTV